MNNLNLVCSELQPLVVAGHEGYCRVSSAVREIRVSAESAKEEAIAEALFRYSDGQKGVP